MTPFRVALCSVLLSGLTRPAVGHAEVTRVEAATREDVMGGRSFGAIGAYERVVGRAYFTLDPLNSANDIVTDLKLAPRGKKQYLDK